MLTLYNNYEIFFFHAAYAIILKMREFRNFKHYNSSRMVILVVPATALSVFPFCSIIVITSGFIPHNYVSTLSLSFIHESGTLPSTDANPDNLGEYAVSLGRDSAQNCCNADFSLLPLSHEAIFSTSVSYCFVSRALTFVE